MLHRQQGNWRFEDDPQAVCPAHGPMTRAYYGDTLAWIACRTCNRTPADFLRRRDLYHGEGEALKRLSQEPHVSG